MHRSAEHSGCSHKVCSIRRCTGTDSIGNNSVVAHTLGTVLWYTSADYQRPTFRFCIRGDDRVAEDCGGERKRIISGEG